MPKKKKQKNTGEAIAAYVGGSVASGLASLPIQAAMAEHLKKDLKPSSPPPKADQLKFDKAMNAFKKHHKLKTLIERETPMTFTAGPHYMHWNMPSTGSSPKSVGLPKNMYNKAIGLHELGHAVDYRRFGNLKGIARLAGPLAGSVGAVALLKDEDKRKYAPLAAAAGFAPTLRDEAVASHKALKFMKKTESAKTFSKSRKLLTKMFGTYALLPATAAAGAVIAGKYMKSKDRKINEK